MTTVFPSTWEQYFQGLGRYSFGLFHHPFPNLCQRPPKTTPNTKNYKKRPPKWYRLSCPSCPGIALWALGFRRWIQNSFFMCPGAYEASKQHQHGAKMTKNTTNILQSTSKPTLFSRPCGPQRKQICACHFMNSSSVPGLQSDFSGPPGDAKRIEYIYIYIYIYYCILLPSTICTHTMFQLTLTLPVHPLP